MLVEVDPPVVGDEFSKGAADLTELLILTRHAGSSLFPIKGLPFAVYVIRILDESITATSDFAENQVELIGWADVFRTAEDADIMRRRFGR
jgi:hypothetical protein